MVSTHFDAIVVGGGPAGSMTAYFLARSGVRVAVIDSSVFPRPKACGGGLQVRAIAEIPFDLASVSRGKLSRMTLSAGLRDIATNAYTDTLVQSVLRSEFDEYLIRKAAEAGACIYEGTPVRDLDVSLDGGDDAGDDKRVVIRTDRGEFSADCLVGADGANSIVRKRLNERGDYFWQAAVYCEIPGDYIRESSLQRDCMQIDWGTLPSGYAWVFPKDGYVNVGAGGPFSIARHLKEYVARFLKAKSLLRSSLPKSVRFIGHQLPTLTARTKLASKRVVLVGDAAGLVEPFTGDGISFACQSARTAAECILRALNSRALDLTEYHARIMSRIGPELMWSRKLLSLSVSFPKLIPRLFKESDQVWQTFCKTLRGEGSFRQLKQDVLGPLRFAWKGMDWLASARERKILNSFSDWRFRELT